MVAVQLGFVAILSQILAGLINHEKGIQLKSEPNLPLTRISPVIINTWPFTDATEAAWNVLKSSNDNNGGGKALVAVEAGASKCEELQCDGTVGFGGSPDENGETNLDALIMDGDNMEVGAVANLRHIKQAVTAARLVKDHTCHSMLAGLQASEFSQLMGLEPANLTTEHSAKLHTDWLESNCQPNFRKNVSPNPKKHCGPYSPLPVPPSPQSEEIVPVREKSVFSSGEEISFATSQRKPLLWPVAEGAHDTISLVALDAHGSMAAACSTNGAINKIPGRVGDGAIAGGGAYVDSDIGGCGATGDGDIHIRFLPCYQVIENMRNGMEPREAAEDAIRRIVRKLRKSRRRRGDGEEESKKNGDFGSGDKNGGGIGDVNYRGAVIALSKDGRHGAASYGWNFSYSYRNEESEGVQVVHVKPLG